MNTQLYRLLVLHCEGGGGECSVTAGSWNLISDIFAAIQLYSGGARNLVAGLGLWELRFFGGLRSLERELGVMWECGVIELSIT